MANREKIMFNGVLVTPQEFIINFSGGKTSMTYAGTRYVDKNGSLLSYVIQTTGQTCTPVSLHTMPSSVKIGDFGILPEMTCGDNTIQEQNWRVEDAKNGNVNIISNVTVKNQLNTIVSVSDVTYKINGSGDILSFKIVSTQPAGNYKITLQLQENSLIPKAAKAGTDI